MVETLKIGLCKFYIYKERGNTYVKNKNGESKPLKYGAYISTHEPFQLRDFMNVSRMTLIESAKVMEKCEVVLTGNAYNVFFYDIESVNKFVEEVSNLNKIIEE